MKVVVIGATGFIGLPVSQAFVRAGHTVYGVTRTSEKVIKLISEEIHPIVGDPATCWLHLIPTIDAVIQVVGGQDIPLIRRTFDKFRSALKKYRPSPDAPKISYIQTSGTGVYGDNLVDVLTDLSPHDSPNSKQSALLASMKMPEFESTILNSQEFNGIVVRPGMIYGKSGSLFSMLFRMAVEQDYVTVVGGKGGKYSACHTDDLADLYLRAAERAPIAKGLTFLATNEIISRAVLAERIVEVAGAKGGVIFREAANPMEEALALSQICRPYLAKTLLDWSPKKVPLVENIETYFYSWLASEAAGNEKYAKLLKGKFGL